METSIMTEKNFLTEAEIEDLKKIHPEKKKLRYIFLFSGMSLIILGILFLLIQVDFGVKLDDINLSFMVDILIIVAGMILASKYFIAPYYLRENSLTIKKLNELREPVENYIKFNSFSVSRLLAGFILIIVGFMNYLVFGIGVGHHETRYGNAFVLGGPSFFYFTGLPALVIGFSLMLYVVLSTFRGTFSKSPNFYFFYELRPACPWLTEIPRKDIEAVRYQNTEVGPKPAWIMLLIPFIVMQLQTGIPLFFNNERAAPEYVFSWTLLITSIAEIVVLGILVLYHQDYFEIATNDLLYEMWFSPFRLRSKNEVREEMKNYLECGVERDESSSKDAKGSESKEGLPKDNNLFSNVSNTHFQLFNLIFGSFLFVSGLLMLINMILFGPLFWWVALMYGLILLVKSINKDFSRKGEDKFSYDEKLKSFKFQRKFSYKFYYVKAKNIESVQSRKWFRKLDFFDIFGLGGMLIMLTLQQVEGWSIADSPAVIIDNTISTIFLFVTFIFIFLYLCLPVDVIEFKTATITYRIKVTKKLEEETRFKQYVSNLKTMFKDISPDMKKTFKQRFGIFALLIVGTLIYAIITLIGYFV